MHTGTPAQACPDRWPRNRPEPPDGAIQDLAAFAEDVEALAAKVKGGCAEASQRVGADPQGAELLRDALTLRSYINDVLSCAVTHARQTGLSWREIGDLFGVSRQAAYAQFSGRIRRQRRV